MIVSDDNVFPLYGEIITKALSDSGFECHSFVLPHGEPTKSFQSLPKIYEALINAKLTRSDLLIALGGGVIGDLAGFAAAVICVESNLYRFQLHSSHRLIPLLAEKLR